MDRNDKRPRTITTATMIPELLDQIFLYLGSYDLSYVASLVCRQWRVVARNRIIFMLNVTEGYAVGNDIGRDLLSRVPISGISCLCETYGPRAEGRLKALLDGFTTDSCSGAGKRNRMFGSRRRSQQKRRQEKQQQTQTCPLRALRKVILGGRNGISTLGTLLTFLQPETVTTLRLERLAGPMSNWHILLEVFPNLQDLHLEATILTDFPDRQRPIFDLTQHESPLLISAALMAEKLDTSYQNNLQRIRKRPLTNLFLMNADTPPSTLKRIQKECPRLRKYLVLHTDNDQAYDRGFYAGLVSACPLLYGFHIPNITMSLDEIEDLLSLFHGKLTVLSIPEMYANPNVYAILGRKTPKLEELLVLDKPSNGLVPSLRTLQMFLTSVSAKNLRHLILQATAFYGDNFDINSLHQVDRVGHWFPSAGYSESALGNVQENPASAWILAGNAPRITPAVHIKEPWTCRFLETLHLRIVGRKLYFRLEDDSRVLFGYLSRVCPLLRDLTIERKRQSLSLKGGFCLLSRLHHLERVEMKAQYGDLSDLGWICRYPTALQKLGWLVKAQRLRKSHCGFKDQDEDPNVGSHSTGYQTSGAIDLDKSLTKEDLRDVGYLDDIIELLQERARPGFGNGRGCWPRLRELYLPRQIQSTAWSRPRDQPDVLVHRYRPEVKTGTFEKEVGPGVLAMATS